MLASVTSSFGMADGSSNDAECSMTSGITCIGSFNLQFRLGWAWEALDLLIRYWALFLVAVAVLHFDSSSCVKERR